MNLIQRKFYFPQDMYTQLSLTAKIQGKSITQLLREFVAKGLNETAVQQQRSTTQALLSIAEQVEQEYWSGPDNLSENHDQYFQETHKKEYVKR